MEHEDLISDTPFSPWALMGLGVTLDPISSTFQEMPTLKGQIERFHPIKSACLVAGLLTDPSLLANTIRIELLIHLPSPGIQLHKLSETSNQNFCSLVSGVIFGWPSTGQMKTCFCITPVATIKPINGPLPASMTFETKEAEPASEFPNNLGT